MNFQEAKKEFEGLKASFAKGTASACVGHLEKLKLYLVAGGIFASEKNVEELLLQREIVELGVLVSIHTKDMPSFTRFISYAKTFYRDFKKLPLSERMYMIYGLDLLHLLVANKLSEFHSSLELLEPKELENIYIKHPVQLEQWLMEGNYNKVWISRKNVPANEYLFFIDQLVETIRGEVALCSEKAYKTLPLSDAATLLYLDSPNNALAFAQKVGKL